MKIPVYETRLVRQSTVAYRAEAVTSSDAACRVIVQLVTPILADSTCERFLIVSLDTKLKPIGVHQITVGTLDASLVHPREVFQAALLANSSAIILVHNHPSGDLTPSMQDYQVTDNLKKAGDILGVRVLDHIIVGHDDTTGEFKGYSIEYHRR